MKPSFYITTPIYYVNDVPHIGSAYTTIACDVIARFKRLDGFDVRFMTGTDEHGQKIDQAAKKAGIDPQTFTDQVSQKFRDAFAILNISNDDFIRTTEARHKLAATTLWQKLQNNGHIYLGKYSGWYSVRDEAFFHEKELVDGKAPTGAPVEWVEEESYFFDLSKWQDQLLQFYCDHPNFITPESRRNEVISFVKSGLQDLSISRTSFDWGIKVPGDSNHIMYVWLDALSNYLTVAGYPDQNSSDFQKYWPANMHMVGKDIIRFHAVYWPAFLMAADILPPKQIVSHGWWLIEGEKMSKSLGNVVNPVNLVKEYSLDAVRYYLMREISFGHDGNFSKHSFIQRNNSELANNIGNLAQRSLSMIYKNCNAQIPSCTNDNIYAISPLLQQASQLIGKMRSRLESLQINLMLEDILELASAANAFIDHMAPWELKKTNPAQMAEVLYILAETIRYIGISLLPFVPDSAHKILDQLRVDKQQRNFAYASGNYRLKSGVAIEQPVAIFTKFEL